MVMKCGQFYVEGILDSREWEEAGFAVVCYELCHQAIELWIE